MNDERPSLTSTALRSVASTVGDKAAAALAKQVRADPLRALAMAAGAGAVLMTLAAMIARSGVDAVARKVRR